MIAAVKWLVRKCPNVLVLLAGLWLAATPWVFVSYVEDHIMAWGSPPTGFDAVLYYFHEWRYGEVVTAVIFFLGCGIVLTALIKMAGPHIRQWTRPK
jgi:hypothetical protein